MWAIGWAGLLESLLYHTLAHRARSRACWESSSQAGSIETRGNAEVIALGCTLLLACASDAPLPGTGYGKEDEKKKRKKNKEKEQFLGRVF